MYIRGLSRKHPSMYYEKWRHLLKKMQEQETLSIAQRCLSPLQSVRHLATSHSSTISCTIQNTVKPFVGIAISCPIVFS